MFCIFSLAKLNSSLWVRGLGDMLKFSSQPPSAHQSVIANTFMQVCARNCSGWGIQHPAEYTMLTPRDTWLLLLFIFLTLAYVTALLFLWHKYLFCLNMFAFTLPSDIRSHKWEKIIPLQLYSPHFKATLFNTSK